MLVEYHRAISMRGEEEEGGTSIWGPANVLEAPVLRGPEAFCMARVSSRHVARCPFTQLKSTSEGLARSLQL